MLQRTSRQKKKNNKKIKGQSQLCESSGTAANSTCVMCQKRAVMYLQACT